MNAGDCKDNSISLRLTVELAGKYALIGIFCLIRYMRWYVGYVISTLFSTFSLSRYVEIGHRQSRPVDECSEEERGGFG